MDKDELDSITMGTGPVWTSVNETFDKRITQLEARCDLYAQLLERLVKHEAWTMQQLDKITDVLAVTLTKDKR